MKYIIVRAPLGLAVLLFWLQANVQNLWAQTTNGTIFGSIHDTTGALTPGASVSAKSRETGTVRSAVTDNKTGPCGVKERGCSFGLNSLTSLTTLFSRAENKDVRW